MDELGYRPNMVARSLRRSKTETYGLISDAVSITRFASGILRGALRESFERDHVLLIAETDGDPERERRAVESLLDRGVDGIIFAAQKSRKAHTFALPPSLPRVNVNLSHAEHAIAIVPDEFAGGRIAVRELIEAGHRNGIALIGHDLRQPMDDELALTARRRLDGIASEMATGGLEFAAQVFCSDWQTEQGFAATRQVLGQVTPTALLCLNDRIAFGAYQALSEADLAIPEDVSVVSFDDDEISAVLRPGLTTVAIPHERMGALAVEVISGEHDDVEDILVPMQLQLRHSIGAPTDRR